jgi:hypothetical protein
MPVNVTVFHDSDGESRSSVWDALQLHLPPDTPADGGDTVRFTSEWEIEPVLNGLREDFPRLRYLVQEVGDLDRGLMRVHINRRRRRIVTRRARRRISVSN